MNPSKPDTLFSKPFLWMLYTRIKTLFGYLHIQYLKAQYPQAQNAINENIAFRERHAKVLLNRVELFYMQCGGKTIDQVDYIFSYHARDWKRYTAQINRFNKVNQLLPDAFQTMAMERFADFVESELRLGNKISPHVKTIVGGTHLKLIKP